MQSETQNTVDRSVQDSTSAPQSPEVAQKIGVVKSAGSLLQTVGFGLLVAFPFVDLFSTGRSGLLQIYLYVVIPVALYLIISGVHIRYFGKYTKPLLLLSCIFSAVFLLSIVGFVVFIPCLLGYRAARSLAVNEIPTQHAPSMPTRFA
jgi:hypothetical protein